MNPNIDLSQYMNPSPPSSDEDDFNDAHVFLRKIPRSILEDEYSVLLHIYEEELRNIPDSDDSEISSSENDDSEQIKDSLANSAVEKQSNSISAEVDPLSDETLSDEEIPSDKAGKKKRIKRRSAQKRNRLDLEYSDSDESDKEPERNLTLESKPIEEERKQVPSKSG